MLHCVGNNRVRGLRVSSHVEFTTNCSPKSFAWNTMITVTSEELNYKNRIQLGPSYCGKYKCVHIPQIMLHILKQYLILKKGCIHHFQSVSSWVLNKYQLKWKKQRIRSFLRCTISYFIIKGTQR